MWFTITIFAIAIGLFVGVLAMLELGRWLGLRHRRKEPDAVGVTGAIDAAVFALLGLLIAFTFSGGLSRFDTRRDLIVQETNAIGTAYLRLDLLPAEAQPPLRDAFRRYLDERIATYRKLPDVRASRIAALHANDIQREIWSGSVAACKAADSPSTTMLLVPALNAMFDIATTRAMATELHPPATIYVMLGVVVLISALLAGYGTSSGKTRRWFHVIGFAAIVAVTIYVILDVEYPRLGLIRVDAFDHALVELREHM